MIQVQNNNTMFIAQICRNRTTSQVPFLVVSRFMLMRLIFKNRTGRLIESLFPQFSIFGSLNVRIEVKGIVISLRNKLISKF